ncbi:MAG TPA: hypothetical protein VN201_01545 [Roseateles sp.]|nr:hypothetical protein [Roseateles sp.]
MTLKISTRILLRLLQGDSTSEKVHQAFGDAHLKTVQINFTNLSNDGFIVGQRSRHMAPKVWSITEAGRAELRRLGYRPDDEPVSPFGTFGEAIGRVPSIFHLGGLSA